MNIIRRILALLALTAAFAVVPAQAGVPTYVMTEEFGYVT